MVSLLQPLLNRFYYVYPATVLLVSAPPGACLQTLMTAARPSTERLHLRNLFTSGRRYYVQPAREGFHLTSNSKVPWRYRARTRLAAVVSGQLGEAGAGLYRLRLTARMTRLHLLDVLLVPGWMSVLLLAGPLSPTVKAIAIVALFGLSWAWHWYSAVLQATEMIYFVQVALEDLTVTDVKALPPTSDSVIHAPAEFQEEWEKFYEAHKHDNTGD